MPREPVEQFRVRGRLSLCPEVFGGGDQATAERHLPEAVDGYPCGKRILVVNEPLRKAQAGARKIGRERQDAFGRVGADRFATVEV